MYYVQSVVKLAIIEKMQYTDNNLGTVLGLKVRSIFKKIFHYSFYNISLITSFGYFSKYYFESG